MDLEAKNSNRNVKTLPSASSEIQHKISHPPSLKSHQPSSASAAGGTYEEGVATVTADHPHPLGLDGQGRLGGLLLWDHHHGAQVDDASAVGGGNQTPETKLVGDVTQEPTPTSLVEGILSSWMCLYR